MRSGSGKGTVFVNAEVHDSGVGWLIGIDL